MSEGTLPRNPQLLPLLYLINRLSLKVATLDSVESLIFTIVNDSHHLIPYDRALLFSLSPKGAELIGISGESQVNTASERVQTWTRLAKGLTHPELGNELSEESFSDDLGSTWEKLQGENPAAVFWLPILARDEQTIGLWLEQHNQDHFQLPLPEMLDPLQKLMMPAFGIAWKRLHSGFSPKHWASKKTTLAITLALLLLAALPVSLRIVAPVEIVAKDPFVVRTPLDGVISEVLVEPGQVLAKETPLFLYEPEDFVHRRKTAQKQVDLKQSELERAVVLSFNDQDAQNELSLLQLEKQKALIDLELAEHEASELIVKAPVAGIALMQQPEIWRGRSVHIGEKVLTIGDPRHTELRIQIPEQDNVPFDPSKPVKVFLNIAPTKSHFAQIRYVSNEATLNEQGISSYISKADWVEDMSEADLKLGLQGSAVLYGHRVPLVYYLLRKPIATLRRLLGF